MKEMVANTARLVLAGILLANATAKLATVRFGASMEPLLSAPVMQELGTERTRFFREIMAVGSGLASVGELVLGVFLALGVRYRLVLRGLGVLLLVFSAFLVVMAALGVPIRGCKCFSWIDPPAYIHFLINGALLAWVYCLLRVAEGSSEQPSTQAQRP